MFNPQPNILEVSDLKVTFLGEQPFVALQQVSFGLAPYRTLAMVGHSGSGKSVTALALMGLLAKNVKLSGNIFLCGKPLHLLPQDQWPAVRGKDIGMVFQEPMSALNPIKTCGKQLIESIMTHQHLSTKAAREKALEWFDRVKLPNPGQLLRRYPHQLSGGQKQRVMIAMAMCNHPALLIADEPTTALDVTVQKEIVDLMKELQQEYGTAILFITHDLALAKTITDDFVVLDQGVILDRPPVRQASGKLNKNLYIDRDHQPLLKVEELQVDYPDQFNWLGKPKAYFKAVQQVNFELYQGETLGLVGESGCGKSTLSKCILGLQPVTAGKILFKGKTISQYGESEFRKLRRAIQIIFQDPYSSLNQRRNIRDTLAEPMIVHGLVSINNVDKQVDTLLAQVQLPLSSRSKYPHEFSGGQRQRIAIARALAVKPELIICDESVAALDIKIQEQILELLMNLQQQQHLTYLFITHDIKVVARICNRILVMEKGRIVEQGATDNILQHPQMPYTQKLLAAVP